MEGPTDERSPSNFNRGNSNRNRSQQNWKKGGNTPVFRPKVQSVNEDGDDGEDQKRYQRSENNNSYSPHGQQSRSSNYYPKFFRPRPPSPVQSGKKQSDTINNQEPKTPESENKAQQRDFASRSEHRREYTPKNEQKREFTPKNDQRRKSTSEIPVPISSKSEKPSRRPKHELDGTLYNYFVKEGEESKPPQKEEVRRKEEEYYSEEVEASSYPPRREFRNNNNRGAQEHKQRTPNNRNSRYDRNQDKYYDQERTFHQERTPTGRFERTPQDRSHERYPQERSQFERTPSDRNNEKSPYERKEKSRDKTAKSRNSNGNERTPRTPINSNKNSSRRGTPSSDKKPPKDRFEPHLTETEVEEGLKNGTLYKGVLRINGRKTRDAYATVQGLSQDVYIDGYITRNRALENDIVIVQLFDKSKWKKIQRKDEDDINSDEEEGRIGEEIVEALFEADTIGKKPFELPLDNTEVAKELSLEALKEEALTTSLGDEGDSSGSQDEEQPHPVNGDSTPVKETTLPTTTSAPEVPVEGKVESVSVPEEKKVAKAEEVKVVAPSPSKAEEVSEEELQPTGKVVAIIERKSSPIQVGSVKPVRSDGVKEDDRFAMFIPSDLKIPKVFVPVGQIPEFYKDPKSYDSKLVKVEILGWKSSAYYPLGKFVGVLGEAGEVNVETEAILVNNEVDFSEFTRDVINCLPKGEWRIDPEEVKRRRDLREERIFTIDPPTARDLDDALHCKRLPDGNFELGVHIADVSFFVKPGTALDKEAQQRSTTVYLVQKAIPMLPHMLCENLCSLNPGVDRYAFSVIWKLSPKGEILHEWFGRSIIRSCSKMPYDVAQLIIEGKIKSSWKEADADSLFKNLGPFEGHTVEQIVQDIQNMQSIAVHLRKKRFEGGALAMSNTKLAFKFDETNNPISTYLYVTREANHLVEEYMLLANQRVAEKISRSFPENALLRNHVAPVMRKLENFVKFVGKHVGIELQADCAKSVAESLEKLRGNTEPMMFSALQLLATRSMQLARYFSTGELDVEDWKHYALNVDRYTHFTSPIRRYPDILVHRLLQAAILKDQNELRSKESQGLVLECEELSDLCTHSNDKKLKARKAQEQSSVLYLWLLLKTNLKLTVEAVSLSLGDKYISALLPCFGIEKRLYMEDMQVYKFEYKEGVLTIWWPQSPSTTIDTKGKVSEEILANAIIQKINVLSVLPVEVSCKGRMDIALRLLHPQENSETGMYKNSKNEIVIATAWQKNGSLTVVGERTSLLEAEENVD